MNKKTFQTKFVSGALVFSGACSFGVLSTIVKAGYAHGLTIGQLTGMQVLLGMGGAWLLYGLQSTLRRKTDIGARAAARGGGKNAAGFFSALTVMGAGTCTGLVGVFYYQAVRLLPASVAIILLMQYLWMTFIIEAVAYKKRPHKKELAAAVAVLGGTVFAGGAFSADITLNGKGVIFGLLSALCYSLFLLVSGRAGNDLPPLKKSALIVSGAWLLTWSVYPPVFLADFALLQTVLPWGAALALFGSLIPPLFFSLGIPGTGVSVSAILSAAELPVAVFASWLVLHESVDALRWTGVLCILAAIVLANGAKK